MINQLRKKFIKITMISVASLVTVLCLIINIANYIITDGDLKSILLSIEQNRMEMNENIPGKQMPFMQENEETEETEDTEDTENTDDAEDFPEEKRPFDHMGRINPEAAYSTRFFVIHYDDEGNITDARLDRIASVTEDDVQDYVKTALKHGEGFGYKGHYKYYVIKNADNRWEAIFVDAYSQLNSALWIAGLSLASMIICTAAAYFIVVKFSRKAVDPVIKNIETQKQFITDASHELKTPITVINTNLKLVEMDIGENKWITKAQNQTEKLSELVNSLVSLAKLDEENPTLQFAKFNISFTAQEVFDSFEDFSASKSHELIADIQPDLEYNGDEYLVRRPMSVLIENAVKYASPGTPIEFSVHKNKKGIIITTRNEYEGERIKDYDRLFERFYREDKSRTSGNGFGIGLSLAQSIVESHKGTIRAYPDESGAIVFKAELK